MSLRKIAGLLVVFGLTIGLIGGGVGAAFTDQVSAIQNISVGTFGCSIDSATGIVVGKTVTYDAPAITTSGAGSAPFTFKVTSTGTIPVKLQVTQTTPPHPFTSILTAPVAEVILNNSGDFHNYAAGLQWATLWNDNLGQTASITYTVNCVEASTPPGDGSSVTFASVDQGVYGGQESVKFAGGGSGFTPGATISVSYSWAAGGPFDLAGYWAYLGLSAPVVDPSGNFTYWFADNCHNGINYTSPQNVVVTATDGTHNATGVGILRCDWMP